ncbi:hypothetical protein WR25_24950 [Diploscapter pachys]|uniref:Neurotransmitter-gated ion-channel ligand-binding domain-containing protein n=1 Tax=Diploscapter pachys TaxID=2018661 RepID=A0A2A2J2Q5_9BILA|nr:hypothetical protein WR25_24950 [Diploscapter pachys]
MFMILLFINAFTTIRPAQVNKKTTYNTTLIRYTTKLLDTILLNQDKKLRPQSDDGSPLVVEIDILIRSMGPISEQNMEFSLDCYFRQKWLDKRLAFNQAYSSKPEIPLASKMLKDIWVPDTFIRNGRKSYLHTLTVPNILFRVRYDGQVHVSQRCPMYLRKFPMDIQACPIEIGSLGYFTDDMVYKWKDVEYEATMGNMLSQYKILTKHKTEMNLTDSRYPNRNLSVLKVYFKLQRQQGYYVLQIYTPCTLLVVMSWVSFWINKEASPARVALGIMTVLSMSTLGFGLRTDLPKVSHHTALDIYILSCFGFVFCAMIEYAVINYAQIVYIRKKIHDLQGLDSNAADDDDVKLAEEKARLEALPWYKRIFFKNQNTSMFYQMAVKAAKARKKLRMRDPAKVVNRIDNFSKIVFPSLFILFNIGYLIAYLYYIPDEVDELLYAIDNGTPNNS